MQLYKERLEKEGFTLHKNFNLTSREILNPETNPRMTVIFTSDKEWKALTDLTQVKHLKAAQDRGPFCFSYILNKILQCIEIWNEFKVCKPLSTLCGR